MKNVVFVEIRNLRGLKTINQKRSLFLYIVPNVLLSGRCQMMIIIIWNLFSLRFLPFNFKDEQKGRDILTK